MTALSAPALQIAQLGTIMLKEAGEDGHATHDYQKGQARCTLGWITEAAMKLRPRARPAVLVELMDEIELAYIDANDEHIVFVNMRGHAAAVAAMDRLLAAQPTPHVVREVPRDGEITNLEGLD